MESAAGYGPWFVLEPKGKEDTMATDLAADRQGNVKLNNNLGIDMELVYLADTIIVTVERIEDELRPGTDGVLIPNPGVEYIVQAPHGAWPTSCYPEYALAGGEFLRYIDACNAGQFEDYLTTLLQGAHTR